MKQVRRLVDADKMYRFIGQSLGRMTDLRSLALDTPMRNPHVLRTKPKGETTNKPALWPTIVLPNLHSLNLVTETSIGFMMDMSEGMCIPSVVYYPFKGLKSPFSFFDKTNKPFPIYTSFVSLLGQSMGQGAYPS